MKKAYLVEGCDERSGEWHWTYVSADEPLYDTEEEAEAAIDICSGVRGAPSGNARGPLAIDIWINGQHERARAELERRRAEG